MYQKMMKYSFVILFTAMLAVPLLTTNLKKNTVSNAEKRILAQFPELYNEDGSRNEDFIAGFETWFNDNVGFRSHMVTANANLQYSLFNVLPTNSDMYLGPNGELNYATGIMLKDFQHLNLKTKDTLENMTEGFRFADEYLNEKGIQLYYFQCWDKHSIYPEQFPDTVIQYGTKSKTDQIVEALNDRTNIHVISPKEKLIEGKGKYDTYSVWGDPTHWTQRGAYIGYCMLMDEINKYNNNRYRILQETDYDISVTDLGYTLLGGIHQECMLENFAIKNPQAVTMDDNLSLYKDDQRHHFFVNDSIDNDTRVLVLGDSYFGAFLMDDLAESFHETVLIWGDYTYGFEQIIETYAPDIVIVENAERCDRTEGFAITVLNIKNGVNTH